MARGRTGKGKTKTARKTTAKPAKPRKREKPEAPAAAPKPAREGRTILDRMTGGVWGLLIALLSLLILIALLSYHKEDVPGAPAVKNIIGPVGAWLAHIVYLLTGAAGIVLAAGTAAFGGLLIAQKTRDLRKEHLLGSIVVLFPLMTLLSLFWFEETSLPQGFKFIAIPIRGGGGIIGHGLATVLVYLVNTTGTVLLSVGAVIAGLSIIFRIHVKSFFLVPYRLSVRLVKWLVTPGEGREETDLSETGEGATTDSSPRVVRAHEVRAGEVRAHEVRAGEVRAHEVRAGGPAEEGSDVARPPASTQDPDATRPGRPAELDPEHPAAGQEGADAAGPAGSDGTRTERPVDVEEEGEGEGGEGPSVLHPDPEAIPESALEEAGAPPGEGKDGIVPSARVRRRKPRREYGSPELSLLDDHPSMRHDVSDEALHNTARKLEEKLGDFRIDGELGDIHPGPVIALYEFRPGRGIKLNTIEGLYKDVAMAVEAEQVRVIAPIPGRDVVGFEIPNKVREMVYLRESLNERTYREGKHRLPLVLGKDIGGKPAITDLTKMPHLLVAGTTGSGKSVALHSFIMSVLFKLTPEQVRFVFVDTKMLELTAYEGIPHLLLPVVTEARGAAVALKWAVSEMERRNRAMSEAGVPNIHEYNQWVRKRRESPNRRAAVKNVTRGPDGRIEERIVENAEELDEFPYIVVVIDELADLMMVAGKQVETYVARLAQMARASGIHMIIATQNPTIKVVTGIIKANMPSRIAFKVRTMQDSRVILDQNGADCLLGYGDMLFLGPGSSNLQRIHGAFVSTEERNRVVKFLRSQGEPEYNEDIMNTIAADAAAAEEDTSFGDDRDDLYAQAIRVARAKGTVSTSALQRELGIGYPKAAKFMARMEKEGLVGPPEAAGKPREFLG